MSRVITVSRNFPAYHPKKGQPTNFPFAIWKSLIDSGMKDLWNPYIANYRSVFGSELPDFDTITPKYHTIRAGNRHKVGDKISLRTWGNDINPKSGRSGPYHSKQTILCPDIEIKKVWKFGMIPALWVDECQYYLNGELVTGGNLSEIAKNDGLSILDFAHWFACGDAASSKRKPFEGQIISWRSDINY